MQEELGEISHAFLKDHQEIRGNEDHYDAMIDGVGDLVVYLAGFCNSVGIDLDAAVRETWAIVKERDWVKYPETGVPNAPASPTP